MHEFAATQPTSILKLPAFFLRFQSEERVLEVNKKKINGENTFNGDSFEIEGSHGSSNDRKNFVLVIFIDL